ncbi:MAG: hypothetical protein AAF694_11410 [Bacteroidota bacterium]
MIPTLIGMILTFWVISFRPLPQEHLLTVESDSLSNWFFRIEEKRAFASFTPPNSLDKWKTWEQKKHHLLEPSQIMELNLTPGTYKWYASIPYKIIRSGSIQIRGEGPSPRIHIDTSEVLYDYREKIQGAYHMYCSMKQLNEQSLQIRDTLFTQIIHVEKPQNGDYQMVQMENRLIPLAAQYTFDHRDGPIDMVTGRFIPNKEELKIRITTKEQITPYRTCFCKGKKIEVYEAGFAQSVK